MIKHAQHLNLLDAMMNYPQEQHARLIGKAGYTMKAPTLASLQGIAAVMQLVLKPNKLVKNVNAGIKKFTSFYKKRNHLPHT